jgi:hypothetical protein
MINDSVFQLQVDLAGIIPGDFGYDPPSRSFNLLKSASDECSAILGGSTNKCARGFIHIGH